MNTMTPEEAERMKKVFQAARATINKTVDDLKSIAFTFDQYAIAGRYDEAEALMGKIATMSVAMNAWNIVKNRLDDFSDPYEAMSEGLVELMDFHIKSENKKEADSERT